MTADDTAFEQALRAMNLVTSNSPLSTDTLNEALELAISAVDAVGIVQSGISNVSSSIGGRSHSRPNINRSPRPSAAV